MKATPLKKVEVDAPPPKSNPLALAQYLEKNEQLEEAAVYYEKYLKTQPRDTLPYNRLMIIFRKLKDVKNELRIIDLGIQSFTALYTPTAAGKNSNVVKLSKQLNILTGLTDKKGNSLHDAGPIGKWKTRKALILKKKTKKKPGK
jgi:hypothetical protein